MSKPREVLRKCSGPTSRATALHLHRREESRPVRRPERSRQAGFFAVAVVATTKASRCCAGHDVQGARALQRCLRLTRRSTAKFRAQANLSVLIENACGERILCGDESASEDQIGVRAALRKPREALRTLGSASRPSLTSGIPQRVLGRASRWWQAIAISHQLTGEGAVQCCYQPGVAPISGIQQVEDVSDGELCRRDDEVIGGSERWRVH